MKSVELKINGVNITVHSDNSISKPNHRFKDKRIQRTFGTKHHSGYMVIKIGGKVFKMHRVIAQAFLPDFHDFPQVDHIDGNRSNNNINNLRMVTNQQNSQAHNSKTKGCSSEYRGVCWHKRYKKWIARCKTDENPKHLGYFDDEREAAITRDTYAYSQGFPLEGLNFPENYS